MNRRGVALIAVLWVTTALAALAGSAFAGARLAERASRNRILLRRAEWGREACAELVLARFRPDSGAESIDTTELGRGLWCRAVSVSPAAALQINLASAEALQAVLIRPELVDALLDWRDADDATRSRSAESDWYRRQDRAAPRNGPFADLRELGLVRGFEDSVLERVLPKLTTRGDGRVDPNVAPLDVVRGITGLGGSAMAALAWRRSEHRPVGSIEEWAGLLAPAMRSEFATRYDRLIAATVFGGPRTIVTLEAGIRRSPVVVTGTIIVVPLETRLAVVRREMP